MLNQKLDSPGLTGNHRLLDRLIALSRRLDDGRIRQHLKRVEQQLRARDVSELPLSLQAGRRRHLDHLHNYWSQGIFPRNHTYPSQYSPCFIDRDGRVCAVAHLLVADGHAKLAGVIASKANYAYLEAMGFPQLEAWVAQSGLSKTELAQIQPTYPCPDECVTAARTMFDPQIAFLARTLMIGTAIGAGSCVVNIINVLRKRWAMLLLGSAIGIVVGAGLLYIGLNFLVALVLSSVSGYIPCPGAGVGNVCNPESGLELNHPLNQLSGHTALIGVLIFLAGWLGLVKGLKQEQFNLFWLLTTLVGGVVLAVPGLLFLTSFLNARNILDQFDLLRFAIYILIVTGCTGLMMWLLGKSNSRSRQP